MSLFGFNFTSNQAVDYIKQNWKPGKREFMYVGLYAAVFIIGELLSDSSTISYMQQMTATYNYNPLDTMNPTGMPPIDWNLMVMRDFLIDGLELFSFFTLTYLYFTTSDKSPKTALKWGVGYALPVTVLSLIFSIYYSLSYPPQFGYSVAQMISSDIIGVPLTFLTSLLSAGGLYLLFVYKPNLKFIGIGYVAMVVCFTIFSVALEGFSPYTAWSVFDGVIALSLISLYLAVKSQIRIKFPTLFLYGGIGVGFLILAWISGLPNAQFIPGDSSLVQMLSFISFGVVTYLLLTKNVVSQIDEAPLPPPPPEPT